MSLQSVLFSVQGIEIVLPHTPGNSRDIFSIKCHRVCSFQQVIFQVTLNITDILKVTEAMKDGILLQLEKVSNIRQALKNHIIYIFSHCNDISYNLFP